MLGPVAHAEAALPRLPFAAAAAPGLVLFLVAAGFHGSAWASSPGRAGLILLAIPAAFLLDDPAAGITSATPRSPWWDLAGRLIGLAALCCSIAAMAWWWNNISPTPQAWLLAVIPICAAVAGCAGAGLAKRAGRTAPGEMVGGVMGLILLVLLLFQPRTTTWEILPTPGSASGAEVAAWIALGCGSGVVLLIATSRGAHATING